MCTVCTVLYSLNILKLIGPEGTNRLYSVYSFVQYEHFQTDWFQRDPQVAQFVQFCTVLCSLKLIGNKGTNSIVSDLVNILKMIGLEGTLSVNHIQNTDF